MRLDKHGFGLASGPHEIYGLLDEEMDELKDEMRADNLHTFREELVDIAIAAIYGIVSANRRLDFERGDK